MSKAILWRDLSGSSKFILLTCSNAKYLSPSFGAPKEGERYFALLQVSKINFEEPDKSRHKIAFDNLTPLYPDKQLVMEVEVLKTEKKQDLTPRLIDLVSPIGKGQR